MSFEFSKEPGRVLLNRGFNTEGEPLVSIITPYYNAGKYFAQTYRCVMNQTFPWFEWIIVNDGSTNNEDINSLEELAGTDERIKIFHKENGGTATARNVAIKNCRTEIIITLDADDLIVPTYVECIYWGLYFNPEASWCYTNSIGFQNQEYLWDKKFNARELKTYNFLTYSAGIRKKDLLEVGCYDEIIKHYYEDWRIWLKLLSKSKFPVKLGYYGFWYRRTDSGVLATVNSDPKKAGLARKLIVEAAATADTNVVAKEYPCGGEINRFIKPQKVNWDRNIFKEKKKTHILMLLPWLEVGGADIFNLDIVSRIDKNEYEMSIITTVHGENAWRQLFEEHVTDVFDLTSFLDVENYAEFISYFIQSREIDILFVSNSYYGYYLLPWLRKEFPELAIVDYVHMEEWYWRNGGYARTSGAVGDIIEKTYVCNERTRQIMINNFSRRQESVETLYIGVDEHKYDANLVAGGKAKASLGISEERPIVLFPCRIHPQKRPFLMVEIVKGLKKIINDIAIVVVGDGPQLNELKTKVKNEKLDQTIYFAGRQNEMRPYYRDADITLICSIKEGLALTAYESMAMGVPVVSSDVGGQAELIDREVGAIIPLLQDEAKELNNREYSKEEIESYVEAIERIISDQQAYEKMSRACRVRIEEKFSSNKMIEKLVGEFTWLLSDINIKKRRDTASLLNTFPSFVDDYVTVFNEYEYRENAYKYKYVNDTANELMRIASSKFGSFLIKVMFKLKINRLFK